LQSRQSDLGSLKEPGSALAKRTKELIYWSQRRAFAPGAIALDRTGDDFTLLPKMHFGVRDAAVRTCEVVERRIGMNPQRLKKVLFVPKTGREKKRVSWLSDFSIKRFVARLPGNAPKK
jgi:hypothetical protein